jgi:putative copper export protein
MTRTLASVPSLASGLTGFRLTLHVLAAALWVGGQFTVAGLLPTVRAFGEEAPKAVARVLARMLWPAYAVLVATGFWNVSAVTVSGAPAAWKAVLVAKIVIVAAAGLAVLVHQRSTTSAVKAISGALGAVTSVGALVLGVFLAG